jgi:Raf kinase inhibitor-like YbhB/YbcL family protein
MEEIVKTARLIVGSTVFAHEDFIPVKYTCQGKNINPPITIEKIPSGTKSLAIIVEDPDAPSGIFDHWIIWNIPPTELIFENSAPGVEGKNGFGKVNYQGPCPPEGKAHRYFFKVYALDKMLDVPFGSTKAEVERAMQKNIVAKGEFIGMYKKV